MLVICFCSEKRIFMIKRINSIVLFLILAILGTACGKNTPLSEKQEAATAVPVSVEKKQKVSMEIHQQIQVLAKQIAIMIRRRINTICSC